MIEAKGGTSTRQGSARFEKGFNRSQVFDRVAKCLYTAAQMYTEANGNADRAAMAFPDTPIFRDYLSRDKQVTDKLQITIFLVKEDNRVNEV